MRHVLLPCALASVAFAPAPFPKAGPCGVDLERMQGHWAVTSE